MATAAEGVGSSGGRSYTSPTVAPALIFDFDGIVIASEEVIYETWREYFVAAGHDLPLELWSRCIGGDVEHFDPGRYAEQRGLGSREWVRKRLVEAAARRCSSLPAKPGVRGVIAAARAVSLPLGVASSSPRAWVEGHLERLGLLRSFSSIRTRDDGTVKPSPYLYQRVLQDLGADPSTSWGIEDSGPGVRSAKAAGLRVLAIPNAMTESHDLSAADRVVESLEEVTLEGLGL